MHRIEVIHKMRDFQLYLCGGMGKFGKENFNESNDWRVYCKRLLENSECNFSVKTINPNDYFNFKEETPKYQTQREIMELDFHKLVNSDLVIINYNDVYSLGSMAELAIAYEKRIPVIGLNLDRQELHPWQKEMTNRIFVDMNEMIDYVEDYYLS